MLMILLLSNLALALINSNIMVLLSSKKMPLTMMKLVLSAVMLSMVFAEPDIVPGCLQKCSDEVKCKIEFGPHCVHDMTPSKLVASELTNLVVTESKDDRYKYFNLEWTPPDDGSFRDLEAFDVNVGFTSHDHQIPGQRGGQCFKINILDTDEYIRKYSNMSVKFYLRCIRISLKDFMTIRMSIYSLPLNVQRPKMVPVTIRSQPMKWGPDIQRWADKQDRMHIRIRNPHPMAMFYRVTLFSPSSREPLFERIFPARHIAMKDEKDSMTQEDDKHYPHFVIKSVPRNITFFIRLRAMYGNMSAIPDTLVYTKKFSLNFTKPAESPQPSISVPKTKSEAGLSGQLVTIILVIALFLFIILGLVIWKTFCQPTPLHPLLVCRFLVPSISNNMKDKPKILPIYCDESEDFVRAVESHVSLLQRYVNVLPVADQTESRSGWCPLSRRNMLWTNSELKVTDIIIYLSPGLGQLTSWRQVQGLSKLDQFCHQTLQTLQASHNDSFTTHIVTFDCFGNDELQCLPMLGSIITSRENTNAMQDGSSSFPLKLASFRQNSWKLENFEQLLFQICQARDFPQELPLTIQGWRDSPEAVQVEHHLSRLRTHDSNMDSNFLDCIVAGCEEDPNSECLEASCENETDKLVVDMGESDKDLGAGSDGEYFTKFSQKEGCVSADSSGFYSTAQGNFPAEVPKLSACSETMAVDLNNIQSSCVMYTKPDNNGFKQVHSDQTSDYWPSQKESDRLYIRPPPSLSLRQDNQNATANTSCLVESDSDNNEYVSSSLESDTLLTKDDDSLHKRSENRKYSLRSNSTKAISPPSSLVYSSYKKSISDLIGQANNANGWSSSTYI